MTDHSESYKKLAESLGVPLIKKRPAPKVEPNAPIGVCGECGATMYRVMHFSCPHMDCPCGLGPVYLNNCLNIGSPLNGSMK